MSGRLIDAPNIGPRLAAGLRAVGVLDVADLRDAGATAVWDRLRAGAHFDCLHSLLALEGAIQGVRWHDLDASSRNAMADHFERSRS